MLEVATVDHIQSNNTFLLLHICGALLLIIHGAAAAGGTTVAQTQVSKLFSETENVNTHLVTHT